MKATYLLRQCPWLTTDERRVARYIARHAQKALLASAPADAPPLSLAACAIHALATGHALYQRAQQRLADALAPEGDAAQIAPLAAVLLETQNAYLAAHHHLEQLAHPQATASDTPAQPAAPTTPSPPHPDSPEGRRVSERAAAKPTRPCASNRKLSSPPGAPRPKAPAPPAPAASPTSPRKTPTPSKANGPVAKPKKKPAPNAATNNAPPTKPTAPQETPAKRGRE